MDSSTRMYGLRQGLKKVFYKEDSSDDDELYVKTKKKTNRKSGKKSNWRTRARQLALKASNEKSAASNQGSDVTVQQVVEMPPNVIKGKEDCEKEKIETEVGKKEDAQKAEVNTAEVKKVVVNTAEVKKVEVKKVEVNTAEVKKVEVKKVEVKKVEVKKVEVKKVEVKKVEAKKADVKKAKGGKAEAKKGEKLEDNKVQKTENKGKRCMEVVNFRNLRPRLQKVNYEECSDFSSDDEELVVRKKPRVSKEGKMSPKTRQRNVNRAQYETTACSPKGTLAKETGTIELSPKVLLQPLALPEKFFGEPSSKKDLLQPRTKAQLKDYSPPSTPVRKLAEDRRLKGLSEKLQNKVKEYLGNKILGINHDKFFLPDNPSPQIEKPEVTQQDKRGGKKVSKQKAQKRPTNQPNSGITNKNDNKRNKKKTPNSTMLHNDAKVAQETGSKKSPGKNTGAANMVYFPNHMHFQNHDGIMDGMGKMPNRINLDNPPYTRPFVLHHIPASSPSEEAEQLKKHEQAIQEARARAEARGYNFYVVFSKAEGLSANSPPFLEHDHDPQLATKLADITNRVKFFSPSNNLGVELLLKFSQPDTYIKDASGPITTANIDIKQWFSALTTEKHGAEIQKDVMPTTADLSNGVVKMENETNDPIKDCFQSKVHRSESEETQGVNIEATNDILREDLSVSDDSEDDLPKLNNGTRDPDAQNITGAGDMGEGALGEPEVINLTNKRKHSPSLEELDLPAKKRQRSSEAIEDVELERYTENSERSQTNSKVYITEMVCPDSDVSESEYESDESTDETQRTSDELVSSETNQATENVTSGTKRPSSLVFNEPDKKKAKIVATHEEIPYICNGWPAIGLIPRAAPDLNDDEKNIHILKKLLFSKKDQGRIPKGMNDRLDTFWEKAGQFGSRVLCASNKIFKIEDTVCQVEDLEEKIMYSETRMRNRGTLYRDCETQIRYSEAQIMNSYETKMENMVKGLKSYMEINFRLKKKLFRALKKKVLKTKVRKYGNEKEYLDIQLPDDQKRNVIPVETMMDGRCFYHAVTLHIYNEKNSVHTLPDLLKLLLAFDLMRNEKRYASVFTSKSKNKEKDDNKAKRHKTILKLLSGKHWADSWIIECMSVFLKRKIISYRQFNIGSNPYKTDCEFGKSKSKKSPILVAYLRAGVGENNDHYIALLKRRKSSKAPTPVLPKPDDQVVVTLN